MRVIYILNRLYLDTLSSAYAPMYWKESMWELQCSVNIQSLYRIIHCDVISQHNTLCDLSCCSWLLSKTWMNQTIDANNEGLYTIECLWSITKTTRYITIIKVLTYLYTRIHMMEEACNVLRRYIQMYIAHCHRDFHV